MIAVVIVMKFGGTSVGGPVSIRQVTDVIEGQLDQAPVVVVSAHSGVTDALLHLAKTAPTGRADVEPVAVRHREILRGLDLDEHMLDPLLSELADLVRGVQLVGEATPKAVDALLSYGERCSARVLAAVLMARGVEASAVDAFDAGLRTDSSFGRARPLPDDGSIKKALAAVPGVPVVTGFLGGDERGNITTLGRNGSDYSAALFGAALDVEMIQIWKDVDGVHTADPRLVPEARPIRRMSFDEVAVLASFGSQVLHPAAMVPAMMRGIRMQVRNTSDPSAGGTMIEVDGIDERSGIRAIAHRRHMALVTVSSQQLIAQHAFLARVFEALAACECDAATLSVGEAAIAVAVPEDRVASVRSRLVDCGEVRVELHYAIIGVIGNASMLRRTGFAEVLATLSAANSGLRDASIGLPIASAGLGAMGRTVAVVIEDRYVADAVKILHDRLLTNS